MPNTRRVLSIIGWTIVWFMTLALVLIFIGAGIDKFNDGGGWARAFTHWGYPVWFRILIGVLEVGAALLLIWPRTALIGAAIIIVVMLGGMGTHVLKDHGQHLSSEVGPLVFASIVLAARRRLLLSQGHHWIDFRRPPSRQVAG